VCASLPHGGLEQAGFTAGNGVIMALQGKFALLNPPSTASQGRVRMRVKVVRVQGRLRN